MLYDPPAIFCQSGVCSMDGECYLGRRMEVKCLQIVPTKTGYMCVNCYGQGGGCSSLGPHASGPPRQRLSFRFISLQKEFVQNVKTYSSRRLPSLMATYSPYPMKSVMISPGILKTSHYTKPLSSAGGMLPGASARTQLLQHGPLHRGNDCGTR